MTLKVFLLCLAAGLLIGAVCGALSPLRKSAGKVFTVLTDVGFAFASVALHAAVMYLYTDGRIFAYAVAAQLAGFAVAYALAAKATNVLSAKILAVRKKA